MMNMAVSSIANANPLDEGLVAYYPFNGNAQDESGNGNHGTEYGDVSYIEGKFGQAAHFDGDADAIYIPNTTINTRSLFSISLWFRSTDVYSSLLSGAN